ncbi:MAG TPA: outer membrane lipoprotein carrier protein LolA [Longimicrobiales bacterium]|nr:outer membrane lipoprotein carrier protein LolA [Longimicrobiales bacterium]
MKRILLVAALVAAVVLIALVTRDRLPRVEEVADTVPGAVIAPGLPLGPDSIPADSLGQDSVQADSLPDDTLPPDSGPTDPSASRGTGAASSTPGGQAGNGAASPTSGEAVPSGPAARQSPGGSGQQLTADAILARAAAAYADVQSMQAEFAMTMTNPLLRRTTNSRGTLYQRRPDRIALRFSQPDGDRIVSDGEYFWVYYPSVDEKQVLRMPASQGASGGVDLQAQFIGDPTERFEATLHGTEDVGGRSAHVLTLVPRGRVGYTSLKVWLDTRDYLARRFEITEENGSVRRFDLSGLRPNVRLGDDVFRFTPPAGARIVDRR